MAKIKVAGDVMIVESAVTLEDIKTLKKVNPDALSLFEKDEDGKKKRVFTIDVAKGEGSVSRIGMCFGAESKDGKKLAIISMPIPAEVEDAKEFAYEKVGAVMGKLEAVEAQVKPALDAAKEAKKKFAEKVVTV